MNKAYVIKNKEGKYLKRGFACWENIEKDGVFNTGHFYFENKEEAESCIKSYDLEDCEPVEITIAEGNLEQEIKHLKRLLNTKEKIEVNSVKEFKKLKEENKQLEEEHDLLIKEFQKERDELCKQIRQESSARERFVEKVKQLEEQLSEKDKKIERLKQENDKLVFALAEEPDKDELLQLKQDFDILYNKTKERDASIRKQLCDEIRKSFDEHRKILCSNYDECIFSMNEIIEKLEELEGGKENIDENRN